MYDLPSAVPIRVAGSLCHYCNESLEHQSLRVEGSGSTYLTHKRMVIAMVGIETVCLIDEQHLADSFVHGCFRLPTGLADVAGENTQEKDKSVVILEA